MDGIPGVPTLEDVRNASRIILTEKRCTKCQKTKLVEKFYLCKKTKDGRGCWCKECNYKQVRLWCKANPGKAQKLNRRWRENNLKKARESNQRWAKANSERLCKARKSWKDANPKYSQKWVKANPEKRRKISRKSSAKNRNTLKGNLNHRMARAIGNSLRGNKKGRIWETLVGYSTEQLKQHIETNFIDGMTWGQFMKGEIHIDHKIPISVFNFEKPEDADFQRAWGLKNLQPLWASENRKKGNKLSKPFQPSFIFG